MVGSIPSLSGWMNVEGLVLRWLNRSTGFPSKEDASDFLNKAECSLGDVLVLLAKKMGGQENYTEKAGTP